MPAPASTQVGTAETSSTCRRRVHLYLPPPPPAKKTIGSINTDADDRCVSQHAVQKKEENTVTSEYVPARTVEEEEKPLAGIAAYPSPQGQPQYETKSDNRVMRTRDGYQGTTAKQEEFPDTASLYRPLSPPTSDLAAAAEEQEVCAVVDIQRIRNGYPLAKVVKKKVCDFCL